MVSAPRPIEWFMLPANDERIPHPNTMLKGLDWMIERNGHGAITFERLVHEAALRYEQNSGKRVVQINV